MRIKIPREAKLAARRALEKRKTLPKSKKFGLSPQQARKLGITSGVTRARQLIKSDSIIEREAREIARFYSRFKNCKTQKCEDAIDLWGGRKLGRKLSLMFKK